MGPIATPVSGDAACLIFSRSTWLSGRRPKFRTTQSPVNAPFAHFLAVNSERIVSATAKAIRASEIAIEDSKMSETLSLKFSISEGFPPLNVGVIATWNSSIDRTQPSSKFTTGVFQGSNRMCDNKNDEMTSVTIAAWAGGKSGAITTHDDSNVPRAKIGTPYHQRYIVKRLTKNENPATLWVLLILHLGMFHTAQVHTPKKPNTKEMSNTRPVTIIAECSPLLQKTPACFSRLCSPFGCS